MKTNKISIKKLITTGVAILASSLLFQVSAQEDSSKFEISTNVDIYSRYVWRGAQIGNAPTIQPMASITYKGLTLGSWNAYQLDGAFPEFDLYATVALPAGFSLTATDYFVSAADGALSDYFDYDTATSAHVIEGSLKYECSKLPITALVGYNITGLGTYKNAAYAELQYAFDNGISLMLGAGNEVYSSNNEFKVVNVGVTFKREIEVTSSLSVPLTVQLVLNPDTKKTFATVGFSF